MRFGLLVLDGSALRPRLRRLDVTWSSQLRVFKRRHEVTKTASTTAPCLYSNSLGRPHRLGCSSRPASGPGSMGVPSTPPSPVLRRTAEGPCRVNLCRAPLWSVPLVWAAPLLDKIEIPSLALPCVLFCGVTSLGRTVGHSRIRSEFSPLDLSA